MRNEHFAYEKQAANSNFAAVAPNDDEILSYLKTGIKILICLLYAYIARLEQCKV
jgi:hypothetical protein